VLIIIAPKGFDDANADEELVEFEEENGDEIAGSQEYQDVEGELVEVMALLSRC